MSHRDKYELVIGLEVHAQLLTNSKAYASEANEFGNLPNTVTSVLTLAHPGTLPRSNKKVVEYAVKMGLACECAITEYNYYDRKNYFYPDLPKGYQLTQDKTPICVGGRVYIKPKGQEPRYVSLTRIHMEEDAGKSMHLAGEEESLIDLNRAGVPLIEIVTEPDIFNSEEAYAYLVEIRRLVRYLEICDGNMEEGSMRCDANISIKPIGETKLGKRVEVKNMNSFRNVQRAIEHEYERQAAILDAGGEIVSETRMFDAETGKTYSLRTKENLNDYRYFPEPDLQPIIIDEAWKQAIAAEMPPLPNYLFQKFTQEFGLPDYDAGVLTDNKEIALYFFQVTQHTQNFKGASNWVMGPVKQYLNDLTLHISEFKLSPERLAELIALVDANKVSYTSAQQVIFFEMMKDNSSPESIAKRLNLIQESDEGSLKPMVDAVVARFPDKVKEYQKGKVGLLGMFVGEVMKASKGKADPKVVSSLMQQALQEA